MSPTEFWIARGGSACGPYTKDQVDRLVKDRLVYQNDLIWTPGEQGWVELVALFPKRTPVSRTKARTVYKLQKNEPIESGGTQTPMPNRDQSRALGSSRELGNRAADLARLRTARRAELVGAEGQSTPVRKDLTIDSVDETITALIWKTPAILSTIPVAVVVKDFVNFAITNRVSDRSPYAHISEVDYWTNSWLSAVGIFVVIILLFFFIFAFLRKS